MKFTPLHHQGLMIDHLLRNDEAAVFAGMGLGKTSAVLTALNRLFVDGDCKGVLLVAPLRVSIFTWADEVKKWDDFKWMKVVSLRTPEGLAAWERGDACIYTINYESLSIPRYKMVDKKVNGNIVKKRVVDRDTGIIERLLKGKRASQLPVDTVVWDEISLASNHKSKRTTDFLPHRHKFKRHWGLTGTPASNGLINLFAQIKLLDGGARLGKFITHYKERYFEPVNPHAPQVQWKWQVRAGCAGMIEETISDMTIVLRSEDYLDIPPTEVIDVPVVLPSKGTTIYKKLVKELLVNIKDRKVKAVNSGVLVGKLQQIVGGAVYSTSGKLEDIMRGDEETKPLEIHGAKVEALKKLHDANGNQPMLVGTMFTHERERIVRDIPGAELFDSTKLDRWNRGEISMLVADPRSMAHGLNMQSGGCHITWFTLPYHLEQMEQLNARLARTGQTNETKIFRLLAPNTIDDAVVASLESKDAVQSGLLKVLDNLQKLDTVL